MLHNEAQCQNITSSSAIAEGPHDALIKSVEILRAAAQLYEKSHLTRTIALSCTIKYRR